MILYVSQLQLLSKIGSYFSNTWYNWFRATHIIMVCALPIEIASIFNLEINPHSTISDDPLKCRGFWKVTFACGRSRLKVKTSRESREIAIIYYYYLLLFFFTITIIFITSCPLCFSEERGDPGPPMYRRGLREASHVRHLPPRYVPAVVDTQTCRGELWANKNKLWTYLYIEKWEGFYVGGVAWSPWPPPFPCLRQTHLPNWVCPHRSITVKLWRNFSYEMTFKFEITNRSIYMYRNCVV